MMIGQQFNNTNMNKSYKDHEMIKQFDSPISVYIIFQA